MDITTIYNTAPPDWAIIAETIRCPLCEYDLRGLSEPRCPECGHAFSWREVLSIDRRPHPYLFEHHPERNVWSFVQTKLNGLRPWSFWRTLRPSMKSAPRRLVLFWMLSVPLVCVALGFGFLLYARDLAATTQARRQQFVTLLNGNPRNPATQRALQRFGSTQNWLNTIAPPVMSTRFLRLAWDGYTRAGSQVRPSMHVPVIVSFAIWPWLTIASMMVFQASMRRARIKSMHVMRCALYSCDSGLIAGVALIWVMSDSNSWGYVSLPFAGTQFVFSESMTHLVVACVLFAVLTAYKLWPAYRVYLAFPHAAATVFASQVLVGLAVTAAVARYLGI